MNNKIISFRVDVKHLKIMLVKLGCIKHDEFNNNKLLIDIYNNEVTLIKRNLDIMLKQCIDIEILKDNLESICIEIDYALLTKLIKNILVENVQIDILDNGELKVLYESIEVIFDYEIIKGSAQSRKKFTKLFNLNYEDIKLIMDKVGFAAATNDIRPALNSVHFMSYDNQLLIEATDSYRLSRYILSHIKCIEDAEFIVHSNYIKQLLKIIPKDVTTSWTKLSNTLYIEWDKGSISLFTKVCNYPDINRTIPKEYPCELILKTDEIIDVLKQVQALDDIVRISYENDYLIIKNHNQDKCKYQYKMYQLDSTSDFKLAINIKYLLDVLKSLNTPIFSFKFLDERKPIMVSSKGIKDEMHIILPIKFY